jgi:23S rRNA (pseudouridine1915-N3)-methyltransferase
VRITVLCVGRPRGVVGDLVREYEARIERYFRFEAIEVKEASGRGRPVAEQIDEEGERLLARLPAQVELVALHRPGTPWSSDQLARHLSQAALHGAPGIAFAIGGAFGLSTALLARADRLLSLSGMTLPHELARLILVEQLYRAGTITRGEPYHKGPRV